MENVFLIGWRGGVFLDWLWLMQRQFVGLERGRDVLAGVEGVVAPGQHLAGKMLHDGLCLKVQVLLHDVGLPLSREANGVRIDVCAE
jgi:hypothetical protein